MLESLRLGGDGDEIDAIEAVENAFAVHFDQSDAAAWITVGDVFASLLQRKGLSANDGRPLWPKFVQALGLGAALYPDQIDKIGPETRLLEPPLSAANIFRAAWARLVR